MILAVRAWDGDADRARPLLAACIDTSREIGASVLLAKAEAGLAHLH
jgi:hypothetical protein